MLMFSFSSPQPHPQRFGVEVHLRFSRVKIQNIMHDSKNSSTWLSAYFPTDTDLIQLIVHEPLRSTPLPRWSGEITALYCTTWYINNHINSHISIIGVLWRYDDSIGEKDVRGMTCVDARR